ncbi:amyloid-beta-like protein isoform X2 [Frankliniella occidentalis]|uniref:Amyloid-beta-like protein isoform X2 n=1 Tax=Frankliniella occidentalis TaxID=133901 RepID=A0A9C6XQA6_FRAOC|nr:amyloid-beta-like protein isoform X2 [Frankliniella occidentalis]
MMEVPGFVSFLCVLIAATGSLGHVEDATRVSDSLPPIHFEPQVAFLCDQGQSFHPQYMSDQGRWTTDPESKVACLKDKVDVLTYCKKMYPKRDITNIVEASHSVKVTGWCRVGHKKCKHSAMVKPFRCLEGPFQSDALLVPESCLFDHVHNQTRCWEFGRWNETAAQSCADRDMQLRSFAMLLPCGISVFAGVEFVCCPKNDPTKAVKVPVDMAPLPSKQDKEDTAETPFDASDDASSAALDASEDDDEDEDLDEEEQDAALPDAPLSDNQENNDNQGDGDDDSDDSDEYNDEDTGAGNGSDDINNKVTPPTTRTPSSSAAPQPSPAAVAAAAQPSPAENRNTPSPYPTPSPTPDPYFLHFDPRREHQDYKQAQHRLEETHREKVMKDWSDLEERYQEMRSLDPKGALDFKKRMTLRFQKTVQSLEEEGDAEKHQLVAMHQQRVLAHIGQRKKEAMTCYTTALNDSPPNTHRVQKCLQKLLRALHKDRHHTIAHYRHLLASSFEQAEREKPMTLEHLTDIDRMVNQSLQMLQRFPSLQEKIGQLMEDYIQALRSKDDTPGSLLTMTRAAESAILDKYQADVTAQQEEKERQRALERQRKEQRKKERVELREEKLRVEAAFGKTLSKEANADTMEDDHDDRDVSDNSSNQEDSLLSLPLAGSSTGSSSSSVSFTSSSPAPAPAAAPIEREHEREQQREQQREHEREQQRERERERERERPTPPAPELAVLSHKEEGPKIAHAQTHDVSHGEPTFSLRRDYRRESKGVYFTLAFAGIALLAAVVVGIALLRRRSARLPQNQGFVEVDQAATPEERHVANMQINGYENPTYKYFEVKE